MDKNLLNNLRFVFYTNESYFHLLELTLKYFFKYNVLENIKVSVITTNFNRQELFYPDKVEYLNAKTYYDAHGHFTESLSNCLPCIEEDYIFLFLDDYFFIADTKFDELNKILNLIEYENIDYFGFDEIDHYTITKTWKELNSNYLNPEDKSFYHRSNDYRYLFSVQPTIWKKNSLLQFANTYPNLSVHDVDETLINIREENTFKCVGNTLDSFFNYKPFKSDYFIIAYYELIRHGVFPLSINGFHDNDRYPVNSFIKDLIKNEDLSNKPLFKKMVGYYNQNNT